MISPFKRKKGPSWYRVYRAVIRDRILTPSDKIVFLAVKAYANADGSNCFPSAKAIMRDTGMCRDTVFACYARIEARGLFTRVPRDGSSNEFVLHDEEWAKIQSKTVLPSRRKKRTPGYRIKSDTTKSHVPTQSPAPTDSPRLAEDTPNGGPLAPDPLGVVVPFRKEA